MESRTGATLGKDFDNLKNKTITIVGLGGIGSTTANILCRLPFKKIILIDGDKVDQSNFERQMVFFTDDLEKNKAKTAYERLKKFSNVDYYDNFISEDNVDVLKGTDLIMDCTDNFDIRYLIHSFCKENNIPWIHSAVIKNSGNLLFVDPKDDNILKIIGSKKEEYCKDVGVINAAVSVVASWASNMAIMYCAKGIIEESLIRIDLDKNEIKKIRL